MSGVPDKPPDQAPIVAAEPGKTARGESSIWVETPVAKCVCARCAETGGCRHDGMTVHGLCYSCAAEHRG
mgnify:CR=1 FL=1